MRFKTTIIILLASVSGTASAGEAADGKKYTPISAEQFQKMLPGNTITGEYRQMRERTKTYNFSETHHKDGTTDYA